MFSTIARASRDPGLRFPSSCVLQHGAGKRFRARFIIYRDDRLETNDGHEKYSFQIDGLLNLLRSKQSGSENIMPFASLREHKTTSNGGYGDKCTRTPGTLVIALSSRNYCIFRVGKLAG